MKLQRGNWRKLDIENDFLGYDPPDATLYTRVSGGYYCLIFAIIYALHILALFVMKKIVSTDFKNANMFEQMVHTLESTNFAFPLQDWDCKKSGGPDEHYGRMKENQVEVIWNIIINFIFNCLLLTPLSYLCKYC